MQHHYIIRICGKLLIPIILLFALYVQFHGDFGPGGGFQAGVIFGAGVILYTLIYGVQNARKVISPTVLRILTALGVILYTSVGYVAILQGGNFLDYGALSKDPVHGQHLGILLIELGVGITVAAVMISLFYAFSGYKKE